MSDQLLTYLERLLALSDDAAEAEQDLGNERRAMSARLGLNRTTHGDKMIASDVLAARASGLLSEAQRQSLEHDLTAHPEMMADLDWADDLLADVRALDETSESSVTPAQMLAFLTDPTARFSAAQERMLFTNPGLRAEFKRLKMERRWVSPHAAANDNALIGSLAAAASAGTLTTRSFQGGQIRIVPSRNGTECYLDINLTDKVAVPPKLLIMEGDNTLAKLALAEPDDVGTILMILSRNDPEHARLLHLLQDPSATGDFQ